MNRNVKHSESTQSILTLPLNRPKSYAECPTPYQDKTFQLKSINFTIKMQYDRMNFAKNGRFAPIFASIFAFLKILTKIPSKFWFSDPLPSFQLHRYVMIWPPLPADGLLPSPQRPSALTRMLSSCLKKVDGKVRLWWPSPKTWGFCFPI